MKKFEKDRVAVYQSALWKTTSTVFQADEFILIIDPNWLPHEIEEIRKDVDEIRNGRPLYLLFTHGDFDHIIGYGAFLEAQTIGSIGMQQHPKKAYKLGLIEDFDNEYYIDRPYVTKFPIIDHVISEDGQSLMIGDTLLTFYLAPGHTHDGLFTVIEPQGILISGDYLSDFELPYLFDSAKSYLETLEKADRILANHSIQLLIPGHGACTENNSDMVKRIIMARNYVERLIQSVQENDESSVQAIGKEMYYPSSFTKECHEGNIEIIKKEILEELL